MRDYRTNKKENNDYILNVNQKRSVEGKDILSVDFADGRTFTNIEDTPENLAKVMAQQEKQATEGITNMGVFKRRESWAKFATAVSAGATAGAYGLVAEKLLENSTNDMETLAACICGGCLVLMNVIVGGYFIQKNHGIVGELERVNFRNTNRETLKKYKDYPNATTGLAKRKVEYLEDTDAASDPFNIIDIERFSTDDLKKIVENIKTEESFGFNYPTTDSSEKTYQKK